VQQMWDFNQGKVPHYVMDTAGSPERDSLVLVGTAQDHVKKLDPEKTNHRIRLIWAVCGTLDRLSRKSPSEEPTKNVKRKK